MFQSWETQVVEPIKETFMNWFAYIPNILYAVIILFIGWLLARTFRSFCTHIGRHFINQSALGKSRPLNGSNFLATLQTVPNLIGTTGFWLVVLFFIAAALQALGMDILPILTNQFGALIPNVVIALIVFLVTFLTTRLSSDFIEHSKGFSQLENSRPLSLLLHIVIWSIALLIITDQLGVRSSALLIFFTIVCSALFGAFAISFGLGAQHIANNLLTIHYAQKNLSIGDLVEIEGERGTVVEITSTSIVIDTDKGYRHIPGGQLNKTSLLIIHDTLEGS